MGRLKLVANVLGLTIPFPKAQTKILVFGNVRERARVALHER